MRNQCNECGTDKEIHFPVGLPAMVWDCSKECREFKDKTKEA